MAWPSSAGSMVHGQEQCPTKREMWFPGPALLLTNVMTLGKSPHTLTSVSLSVNWEGWVKRLVLRSYIKCCFSSSFYGTPICKVLCLTIVWSRFLLRNSSAQRAFHMHSFMCLWNRKKVMWKGYFISLRERATLRARVRVFWLNENEKQVFPISMRI